MSGNVPATALLLQCPANPGEVVVAVSDGMIFEKKLTRQRGIRVEGDWSRPIELSITERSNHRRRDLAIPQKQIDRLILRDRRGRLEYVGGVGRVESAKVFVELRQVLTMLHLSGRGRVEGPPAGAPAIRGCGACRVVQ